VVWHLILKWLFLDVQQLAVLLVVVIIAIWNWVGSLKLAEQIYTVLRSVIFLAFSDVTFATACF